MTKITGLLVPARGDPRQVSVASLEDMQALVGGYIEPLNFSGGTAYVNEDGIALRLPHNPAATRLCRDVLGVGLEASDVIKGNMLVVGPVNALGDDTDIGAALLEDILAYC